MASQTEKTKNIIITLLVIALIVIIALYIHLATSRSTKGSTSGQPSTSKFVTPVADADAYAAIDRYRKGNTNNETNLVVYEEKDILNYVNCVYPTLTTLPPPAGYHWAVGFYFVRKLMSATTGATKLDFFVTPTLVMDTVDNATHKPLDFYINWNNRQYYQSNPPYPTSCSGSGSSHPATDSGGNGNSYDAGQLWP